MSDNLHKMASGEGAGDAETPTGPMDHILDDLPLMSDDPRTMIAGQVDTEEEQKSRGFLMRPELLKPNQPKAETKPESSSVTVDPNDQALMVIDVVRYSSGKHDTLGRFYIDGEEQCYTLEDEYREEKVRGDTRIPAGTYNLTLRTVGGKHAAYWHKFPNMHVGMLWIREIPNFEYVLIHIGNNDSHTEGCILVGLQPDPQLENQLDEKRSIWSSTSAYKKIYPKIAKHLAAGKRAVIRITDPK